MEEECQIFQIETDEFMSDRLDNKHQHNCSLNVHTANNEALCKSEQVEYENVQDESIYENSLCENSVYEENVGAENGTKETISEENATKGNIFDEIVSKGNVTEENVCADNISSVNVIEENDAEGKFVEDRVDDINVYETIAIKADVDYEQGGNENLVKNDAVDSNEQVDKIEHIEEIEHVEESDLETERSSINDSDATPLQTTLPKSRPISVTSSRYSSLPSSSPSKIELTTANDNNFGLEKTVLGIDINAVHNAVLKGGTRIPESIVNEHPVTIYPGCVRIPGRMSASPTRKVSPNSLTNQIDRPLKNGVNGNDSIPLESKDDSLQYHNLPSSVLVYNKQCPMSLGNDILQSPTSSVFTASNNNELMYISQPNLSMDKSSDLVDGLSLYSSSPPSLYSPPLPASPVTHSEQESLTNDENLTDYHTTTDDEENHFDEHERLIVNNDITDFHTHLGLLTRPSSLLDSSSIGTLPFSMDMCAISDDKVPLLHSKYDENIIPYSNNANGDAFLNIYDDKVAQFNLAELNFAHDEPSKNGLNIGYKPLPRTSLSPRLSSTEYLNERLPDNRNNIIPTYSKFATLNLDHDNTIDIADSANNLPLPLPRISSLPTISPVIVNGDGLASRRELSTPIEEDEEQDNTQQDAPISQIENNISALLRGDLTVARVREIVPPRTSMGFRPGTHKSESTKEMLLSQKLFGPLPPTPLSSSPEETDEFSPLPPSPQLDLSYDMLNNGIHKVTSMHSVTEPRFNDSIRIERPPAVPPHRPQPVNNALITRSMDAGFAKSYRVSAPHNYNNLHTDSLQNNYGCNGRRRLISGAFPKRSIDTNERRLQTSCSLPETPIFARCETISTPHKRVPQVSNINSIRPAHRQKSLHNSSMVDVGGKFNSNRHSACQELNSGEMLRLAGGPARGWYPKQRHPRLSSTENIERDSLQRSVRAWDTVTYNKKPLTLPPNFTPKFFNKSPRDTFRRVTSMLIRKSHGDKEPKGDKSTFSSFVVHSPPTNNGGERSQERQKKKSGFFKKLWKRSKHNSCD